MNAAKEEILNRIQRALRDVPVDESIDESQLTRDYRKTGTAREENVWLFAERVGDYKAEVTKTDARHLAETINEHLARHGIKKLVVPQDIPDEWLSDDIDLLRDSPEKPLKHIQLDDSDGVLSGCALAVAQTGSIVLDSGEKQGRRVLTLLPDYHLCIVFEDQIVGIVPEAFEKLNDKMKTDGPPVTFISGPSATSDIELNRVEGVHGPRQLDVIIVVRSI
ncbi:MAG TPA: lactate utilization protein C [Balneolales bacterium]|nr:lactate utilization protein C [Balneolales bacterium]